MTPLASMLLWVLFGVVTAGPGGLVLLHLMRRWGITQHAYADAPSTHRTKTGTPTMGGLVFVVALLAMLAIERVPLSLELIFLVVFCATIGALDDALKVRHGANHGLRARTKFLATALGAAIFLREAGASPMLFPPDLIFHTGSFYLTAPHWLWILLGILAITGTTHAVNLTDGLDGLAAGSMIPALAAFAVIGTQMSSPVAWISAGVGLGACMAFLVFNRHPAQLFMGDTGSLALGALLAGVAILSGEMLLLVIIGGVFVAEALSVIAQVLYFKLTHGRRIFRMSPLHHHFELLGWAETKVTRRFWFASLLCSLLGWAIVR